MTRWFAWFQFTVYVPRFLRFLFRISIVYIFLCVSFLCSREDKLNCTQKIERKKEKMRFQWKCDFFLKRNKHKLSVFFKFVVVVLFTKYSFGFYFIWKKKLILNTRNGRKHIYKVFVFVWRGCNALNDFDTFT